MKEDNQTAMQLPSRRMGKSHAMALATAAALKAGKRVGLASLDGVEEIVGVPGYDDGRQLPAQQDRSLS